MKAFVKTTLFSIGILTTALASSLVSANIYKHVDEYGNVSYSDKPIQGAQELKIRGSKSSQENEDGDDEGEGEDEESSLSLIHI